MPPQLMSMSSAMRLYMAVLVASLMDGEGLKPNTEPRPVVKQTMLRSEEHTSELQSLMRISYAVFCLKKKKDTPHPHHTHNQYNATTMKHIEQTNRNLPN